MDLTQTNTKRLGGYNRIQIAKLDDIIDFPFSIGQVSIAPDDIALQSGWTTLNLTPGSIKVLLKPDIGDGGKKTAVEITGSYPDDDPESLAIIKNFDLRKCIVRVRGNNDQEKLYGTDKNFLRFTFEPFDSQKTTDSTGCQIKLSGTLINEPLFLVQPG